MLRLLQLDMVNHRHIYSEILMNLVGTRYLIFVSFLKMSSQWHITHIFSTGSNHHHHKSKCSFSQSCSIYWYRLLEIKPYRLGSRIREMEADLIYWWTFRLLRFFLVSRTGTVGWTKRWVKVPKCAVAVWCLAFNSLHGGHKCSPINEISLHISNSRTKPAGLDF